MNVISENYNTGSIFCACWNSINQSLLFYLSYLSYFVIESEEMIWFEESYVEWKTLLG